MIPLYEVDPEHVCLVRDGKLFGRGCGKTIEKMVTLLSYLQPQYGGNKYLFVGENQNHVRDIYRTFFYWIQDSGVFCQYSPSTLTYHAEFPLPPPPTSIIGKLIAFFKKPTLISVPDVEFYFTTADRVNTRGRTYDRIILDLTPKKYFQNRRRIEEAMWAQKYEQ